LSYITPKTFWTTQTKRNLRDLVLSQTVEYIFDTANPFEAAMVDTCITSFSKSSPKENTLKFLDGSKDLKAPDIYSIHQKTYIETQNSVIFKPTDYNLKIYNLYGKKVKDLYEKWWDKISTSKNISKNEKALQAYRESLKPGDVALLGCLTEGGQGLATANNGKYIAVRKSTKWAKNIIDSRPKKLAEAIRVKKIKIDALEKYANVNAYLNAMSETAIADLFDDLKEKYGRDIFGQGYIYRLIEDDEIADVEQLTEDDKSNGIDKNKKFYVPYDKGDKDGNRWYLETPFAIAWSKENVRLIDSRDQLSNPRGIWVSGQNLITASIYLAIRQCIEATWLNDRDQFLCPKNSWQNDTEFHSDCLAFTLFHGQNRISSKEGTNHWIPFTEQEVNHRRKNQSGNRTG